MVAALVKKQWFARTINSEGGIMINIRVMQRLWQRVSLRSLGNSPFQSFQSDGFLCSSRFSGRWMTRRRAGPGRGRGTPGMAGQCSPQLLHLCQRVGQWWQSFLREQQEKKEIFLIQMLIKIAVGEGGLDRSGNEFKLAQMFCNKGNSL